MTDISRGALLAMRAYKLATAMVEDKRCQMVPASLVETLLDWIVLPEANAPGQAQHNVDLMLGRALQIAGEEAQNIPYSIRMRNSDQVTYFQVTKAQLRVFARLVREDAANQAAALLSPQKQDQT